MLRLSTPFFRAPRIASKLVCFSARTRRFACRKNGTTKKRARRSARVPCATPREYTTFLSSINARDKPRKSGYHATILGHNEYKNPPSSGLFNYYAFHEQLERENNFLPKGEEKRIQFFFYYVSRYMNEIEIYYNV